MKSLPILLVLSLLGNAALLYAVMRPPAPARLAVEKAPTASASDHRPVAVPAPTTAVTAAPGIAPQSLWSRVNSDDIDELAARLKAAGFNAREVLAIVGPRVSEKFSPFGPGITRPYWQLDRPDFSDPKVQETFRRNAQEGQRMVDKFWNSPELLATDLDAQEVARMRFGALPLEKLQALQQIESDYQQLSLKASLERASRPGETSTGDPAAALRLIDQEKLADIAKLLTPDEFAAYETRSSPIAQTLRYQLRTFQPTEQEYLAIFALRKSYEAQLNDPTKTPGQLNGVMSDMRKDVAQILGPDRAGDYAAATQNANDETANLVLRLGLPARIAPQVRTLQKDFTAQAAAIRANAQLAATDRAAQLSALAQQARTALSAKLGAQGFEVYDDRKGEWIRALENPAPGKP